MNNSKLTEEDRAWLCSCSSYAKIKKPELTVIATKDVEIMLHNLRFEIEQLKQALTWARNDWTGNEPSESVMQSYFDELDIPQK